MKKAIFRILLLVAAAGIGFYVYSTRSHKDPNRLPVSGNIELTQVDISFKVPGKLIELDVDEGSFVKKGMIIARIDREQVEQQRSRDQAGVASSEAQFQQMETAVRWQRETLESDVAVRRAEVRAAQAKLDMLLAGSRPQEIQQARAAVEDATAQREQAKSDWDRAQELFKNDDISRAQYDQYRTRLESASAVVRQAQEKLGLVQEGPRKEDIEAARAEVERAKAALQASEANRLEVQRREQDVKAHLADLERAKAQVAITQTQINDTVVTSPIDGVVLVKSAEIGEVLAAGTTVVTIGDIDHPWLRAYINETDLGRVKLGQPVQLSADSFPGKTYPGRVSFISSEAEFTPKQIQTREERVKLVYRIKIDAENPRHELKSNMPVDGEIQLNGAGTT
ncbi:MAG TPA: HlyD family efflux transporter periplasmic adaptor subunit [Bryobacteraceae bacterium]|nr:HlyD family efflux transporter periplasmic adaptor subunit [Bryobacteraceae bacterium]